MPKLVVTEFISLDGVIDSPGGGDHPHAGWTFQAVELDEAAYELKGREEEQTGALLLGRQSYEEFAPVWPQMPEFEKYNRIPKYVVSRTLQDPEWHETRVLRSLDEVARLKQEGGEGVDGDLVVHASATLARGLLAADLVDELNLLVFPVVLGGGKRLFADDRAMHRFALLEQASYGNGVQLQRFAVRR